MKELIPVQKIYNGKIKLNDGKEIIMLKIEPTNFKLKTHLEQKSILEGYKLFLKRCDFNVQILVQTQKRELSEYISNVKSMSVNGEGKKEMLEDYINFLRELTANKRIVCRSFYILIEINSLDENEVLLKVKESLRLCDNDVKKCDSEEVIRVIKNYLNREIS